MGCLCSRPGGGCGSAAWSVEPALTRAQLHALRAEFWETRVEGRSEVWQTLRAVCDAGKVNADARAMLAASNIKPAAPGSMDNFYDERGALYNIPAYLRTKPRNLDVPPTCADMREARNALAAVSFAPPVP